MTITSITQQKRNENNVNIFPNAKFWISLNKTQLLELGFHKGKFITEEEKKEAEKASGINKLYEKIYRFIGMRPRSEYEMYTYLTMRRDIDVEEANTIVQDLKNKNLVSDEQFTRWFIENRTSAGFHGVNKIRAELAKKGVKKNVVDEAFKEIESDSDFEQKEIVKIKTYIDKIKNKIKAEDKWEYKNKLMQRLMSRGFEYKNITKAIEES